MADTIWNTKKLLDIAQSGIKKAPRVIGELSGALPAYRALTSTINGHPESPVSELPTSIKHVGTAVADQAQTIGKGLADSAKGTVQAVKDLPKTAENWLSRNEVSRTPQTAGDPTPTTTDTPPTKHTPVDTPTDNKLANYETQLRSYGFDEHTDEQTAQKNLIDMMSDLNLVDVSPSGNIKLKPYSPSLSTILQRSIGALTLGLTLASGGLIPPVPVSKITGAEETEEKRKQMWDDMSKKLSDVYGDILDVEKKGTFKMTNDHIVRAAGDFQRLRTGEAQAMEQALQNALTQASQGADLQKSLAAFNAHLSAEALPFMVEAMRSHGMSKKDIAEWALAQRGSTADPDVVKWLDSYIGGATRAVGDVVGLVP